MSATAESAVAVGAARRTHAAARPVRRALCTAMASFVPCIGCGDGPAPEDGYVPPWASSNAPNVPVWLAEGSQAVAHWDYDAEGNPRAAGTGTAADGIVGGGSTAGSTPAVGTGAGGFTTGGTSFVIGCDWRQDLGIDIDGFDFELHLCMDVFSNLAPSSFSGYTPEQLCPSSIVAPTGVATGSLEVTALPGGCNQAEALASCSVTAPLPGGIVTRYDFYFYDERTYDEETCDLLRDAYSRATASSEGGTSPR